MISSNPYLSFYSFFEVSDHVLIDNDDTKHIQKYNDFNPVNVQEGDIILLNFNIFDKFLKEYYPNIQNKFKLITGRSDYSIKNEHLKKIDKKLIKWYGSNMIATSGKVEPIPLGLQNLNWKYDGNPQSDIKLIENISNSDIPKNKDILMSFTLRNNDRKECYNFFKTQNNITIRNFNQNNRNDKDFVINYFKELKSHKFLLSPFGRGYDCHRTYEGIYSDCIPIMKKHKFNENFRDMPIWFINNWSEVNNENLDKKYEYIINNSNYDKAYFQFWKNKIIND